MLKDKLFERYKVTIITISIVLFATIVGGLVWIVSTLLKDFNKVSEMYFNNTIVFNSIGIALVLVVLLTIDYFRHNNNVVKQREAHFRQSIYSWNKDEQIKLYHMYGNTYLDYIRENYTSNFENLKKQIFEKDELEETLNDK